MATNRRSYGRTAIVAATKRDIIRDILWCYKAGDFGRVAHIISCLRLERREYAEFTAVEKSIKAAIKDIADRVWTRLEHRRNHTLTSHAFMKFTSRINANSTAEYVKMAVFRQRGLCYWDPDRILDTYLSDLTSDSLASFLG